MTNNDHEADYLHRGRSFEHSTIEDLNARWAATFRALVYHEGADGKTLVDLSAELRLRQLPEPVGMVEHELKVLQGANCQGGS
jgi:hypothetical protein